MAEFHLIGSPPLLEATIEHLCEKGARLARRGEFTMRAFLSGRIDLLQAARRKMTLNARKYPVALSRGSARKYSRR